MLAFISHNKRDKEIAREIALFLVSEDVSVWFDEWEILAGDSIIKQIENGLSGASHFLLLWSKHAAGSNWVTRELRSTLGRALQDSTLRIIPMCLDNTPLPTLLADIKCLHYNTGSEADRYEIVFAVTGRHPQNTLTKAIVKKYHELIHEDSSDYDPFGLKACPDCGSTWLKRSSFDNGDDIYYILKCPECGWEDWAQ